MYRIEHLRPCGFLLLREHRVGVVTHALPGVWATAPIICGCVVAQARIQEIVQKPRRFCVPPERYGESLCNSFKLLAPSGQKAIVYLCRSEETAGRTLRLQGVPEPEHFRVSWIQVIPGDEGRNYLLRMTERQQDFWLGTQRLENRRP